jgi:peptide/nickel transport system substrate-binding protein
MTHITRRRLLQGSAAGIGAAALGLPKGASAQARQSCTVRIERDIQNVDPANRIGAVEGNIIRNCYHNLITYKPNSWETELDAAAEIRQVNPTQVDFRLKEGIMFTGNYGELTAEDVKFSYERFNPASGPRAQNSGDWIQLDKVEVTGKYTGSIRLKAPFPMMWTLSMPDVSGAIVSKRGAEALGDRIKTEIAGSGPYVMAEWTANQRVLLRANPDYRGENKPAYREMILRGIADLTTSELAYRSNELAFTEIASPSVAQMERDTSGRLIRKPSVNYVWVGMNVEKAPFNDMRVRRAIRLAVDVDQAILAGYDGTVERANAVLSPAMLGHWREAPVMRRDVAQARRLLAEAGHPNGFRTRLTVLNRSTYQTTVQVLQAQLAEVGIQLELQVLDGGSFWSMGRGENGQNLEMFHIRFGGKVDPSFNTQWFVPEQVGEWNWQRWKSDEFKAQYELGATSLDNAARAAAYVKMQQLMEESNAYIWLTHETRIFAAKTWLNPFLLPNGDDWQYRYFRDA